MTKNMSVDAVSTQEEREDEEREDEEIEEDSHQMRKEYNARGERTYENSINIENAKKIRKIK